MSVSCHPPILRHSERSWRSARKRKEDASRITRQLLTCHKRRGSRADPHLFILPFFFLHMLLVFGALTADTGCRHVLAFAPSPLCNAEARVLWRLVPRGMYY
ncbi:unnamed protein product [Ixodes persulcatus]